MASAESIDYRLPTVRNQQVTGDFNRQRGESRPGSAVAMRRDVSSRTNQVC